MIPWPIYVLVLDLHGETYDLGDGVCQSKFIQAALCFVGPDTREGGALVVKLVGQLLVLALGDELGFGFVVVVEVIEIEVVGVGVFVSSGHLP